MALPYTFASLATIVSSYWDANYAALGALTPIPCMVAGTNSLALTPQANTPTVVAYQNYMQFTGIAVNTNSGAVTAQIGSLAALPVYRDTSSGPVALTSGQIVSATAFTLMYDGALNSGGGGFHITSAVTTGSFLPLSGGTLSGALVGTTITATGPLFANSASITTTLNCPTITGITNLALSTINATTANVSVLGATTANVTGIASLAKLSVGGGASITRINYASQPYSGVTLGTLAYTPIAATIPGASVGDLVLMNGNVLLNNLLFSAQVVSTGTVSASLFNPSAGQETIAACTLTFAAIGFT